MTSKLESMLTSTAPVSISDLVVKCCRDAAVTRNREYIERKKGSGRATLFSPSSLGKCPRQVYYTMRDNLVETPADKIDPVLFRIFANGDAVHYRYQNLLFHAGKFAGSYCCQVCGAEGEKGVVLTCPDECPSCGADKQRLDYAEMHYVDNEVGVSYRPDGWFYIDGKYYCTDFKSINTFSLKGLKGEAKDEHTRQLNFYLVHRHKIFTPDGWVAVEPVGYVFYEDKNNQHVVIVDVEASLVMYTEDCWVIDFLFDCLRDKTPPSKPAEKLKQCKWCDYAGECGK